MLNKEIMDWLIKWDNKTLTDEAQDELILIMRTLDIKSMLIDIEQINK